MTTAPTAPTAPTRSAPRRWGAGRIALVVAGAVLALSGTGPLLGGGLAAWADQQRDADGYLTAGPGRFATDTYAISAPSVHLHAAGPDVLYEHGMLGTVRIEVRPIDAGTSVFVGVGRASDVAAYLDRVDHDEVADLETGPFSVRYDRHPGGKPAAGPAAQSFWTTSQSGPGEHTLTWPVEEGDWTVVIMNADASAGLQADVSTGAELPILSGIAAAALATGGVMLLAGIAMVVAAIATGRPRRRLPDVASP